MKKVVSFLVLAAILCVAAVPMAAANPSAMSLLQVCKVTVDKKVLFINEDDDARTAVIKLACDPNKVNLEDIQFSEIGNQLYADAEGSEIYVEAVAGGAGFILLEHEDYLGVKVRFRVFSNYANETPDLRVKPELSNKDKALIADYKSYMTQIDLITEYESVALDAYNQNRNVNSSNKSIIYSQFNKQIIPNYSQFVYKMKLIKPKSAELIAVHKDLLSHSTLMLEGFNLMKQSVAGAKFNVKVFDQGNAKIGQAGAPFKRAVDSMNKLAVKISGLVEEI